MLGDTSKFEELFDVKIIRRDLDGDTSWVELVDEAIVRGMEMCIRDSCGAF